MDSTSATGFAMPSLSVAVSPPAKAPTTGARAAWRARVSLPPRSSRNPTALLGNTTRTSNRAGLNRLADRLTDLKYKE